ncbi:hypothetical protein C8Q80DRAFT_246231 [Daedaleopsis nitida]|nr:hypothetical protein C8Q80DRAFT_246231 [Daedaleopsis nitida]
MVLFNSPWAVAAHMHLSESAPVGASCWGCSFPSTRVTSDPLSSVLYSQQRRVLWPGPAVQPSSGFSNPRCTTPNLLLAELGVSIVTQYSDSHAGGGDWYTWPPASSALRTTTLLGIGGSAITCIRDLLRSLLAVFAPRPYGTTKLKSDVRIQVLHQALTSHGSRQEALQGQVRVRSMSDAGRDAGRAGLRSNSSCCLRSRDSL